MTDAPPLVRWTSVCPVDRVTPDRGVAALVEGEQVAVFVLRDGAVHAIDDRDPFSGAHVLSRGLIGDVAGAPTVASPVFKQRFDLRTGRSLDDPDVAVRRWATRVHDGWIEVGAP